MSLKGLKNPIRLPDKQKLFADLMSRFNNVRINKMITIWSSYFKFTEMSHYPSTLNNLSRHHFYTTTFLLVSQYVSRPANHTEHFMTPPLYFYIHYYSNYGARWIKSPLTATMLWLKSFKLQILTTVKSSK